MQAITLMPNSHLFFKFYTWKIKIINFKSSDFCKLLTLPISPILKIQYFPLGTLIFRHNCFYFCTPLHENLNNRLIDNLFCRYSILERLLSVIPSIETYCILLLIWNKYFLSVLRIREYLLSLFFLVPPSRNAFCKVKLLRCKLWLDNRECN